MDTGELLRLYGERKREIKERMRYFETTDQREELVFCLCTPQSQAKRCWEATEELSRRGFDLSPEDTARILKSRVRFHNTKARRISDAMDADMSQMPQDPLEAREWLVANIKGFGMKEASHFLRNIGKGGSIAILDRHILKNLKEFDVIGEIPGSLSRKKYIEIEGKMREFSQRIGIPMAELDLLLWSLETGEIFK